MHSVVGMLTSKNIYSAPDKSWADALKFQKPESPPDQTGRADIIIEMYLRFCFYPEGVEFHSLGVFENKNL